MAQPQANLMVPATKRMKFDDLIRIEVGGGVNSKVYTVYSNALTTRSEFFRKALSGTWREAEERVVRLSDDDCETFELYLHLVYSNEIACVPDASNEKAPGNIECRSLAKLYVYCEKVQDTRSKNAVIRALISSINRDHYDKKRRIPEAECVNIIYRGTVQGCPARRLILDIFVRITNNAWLQGPSLCVYPNEFLQELAVCSMRQRIPVPDLDPKPWTNGSLSYLEKEEPDNKP